MAEIKKKQSFGSVTLAHMSPAVPADAPTAYNIHLSFEEALKLHFGLGQLLGKLNSYNRNTVAGKRSAVNLCLFPHTRRLTLNEGRLKRNNAAPAAAEVAESPDSSESDAE